MSRRTMSERMCTGLMLCEAVPCLSGPSSCVPPRGVVAPNKSLAEFTELVDPQSPHLINLLERIGHHSQTNRKDSAVMPNLYEDEKALLIEFMNKIPAERNKQEEIFNAMKRAFGITDKQIDEMLQLKLNKPRIPNLQPGAVLARA